MTTENSVFYTVVTKFTVIKSVMLSGHYLSVVLHSVDRLNVTALSTNALI